MRQLLCTLLCIIALGGNTPAWAQSQTPIIRCLSDEVALQYYGSHEALRAAQNDPANNTLFLPDATRAGKNNATNVGPRVKYTIPVVIHCIHTGLTSDSLSLSRIADQFRFTFEDYRRMPGSEGAGPGADTEIEFALATRDPNGNPSTGVIYHNDPGYSTVGSTITDLMLKTKYPAWNQARYCNIWLVTNITSSSGGGGQVLGYAIPLSGSGNNPLDGVVINSQWFGNRGGNAWARTNTHELGHYLSLIHTFGNSNTVGDCGTANCATSGDNICDTPPTATRNFGLNSDRTNTCTNDSPDNADWPRNYMDYADEVLNSYFTQGQKNRMFSALNNPNYINRRSLTTTNNNQSTGVGEWGPVKARFWASNLHTLTERPVQLLDYSQNSPTKYKWVIPGANFITADTLDAPTVSFAAAGKYTVKLIVGNKNVNGIMDSVEVQDFITVIDTIASVPFAEGFEPGQSFPPTGWYIDNFDYQKPSNNIGWDNRFSFANNVGGFGQSKGFARMRHFYYTDYLQLDGLHSVPFSLQGPSKASVVFSYAYRPYDYPGAAASGGTPASFARRFTDTLSVFASTNAGHTWTRIYKKGGVDLATDNAYSSAIELEPTANQWKRDTICLKNYLGNAAVRLRFEMKNGFGNTISLDDIRIDTLQPPSCDAVTAVNPSSPKNVRIELSPNPTTGLTRLTVELPKQANVRYQVYDLQGRQVMANYLGVLASGLHNETLDLGNLPAGVYLVRVLAGDSVSQQKVLVQN
jgi:hypothetical protein